MKSNNQKIGNLSQSGKSSYSVNNSQHSNIYSNTIAHTQQQHQQYEITNWQNCSTKTGLNYRLFTIPQFYQILQDQKYNQFDVILQSYQLKTYQPTFRQTMVHFLTKQYHQYGVAKLLSIQSIFFQINTLSFIIQESKLLNLNLFKNTFTPNLNIVPKSNKPLQQFYDARQQQLDQLLTMKQQYLQQNKQFQRMEQQNYSDIKSMVNQDIRSKFQLKLILIKFYWRLIQQKMKQIITYRKNLNQQPLVFQHAQYQRIINSNKIDSSTIKQNKQITFLQELQNMQNDTFQALKSYSSQLTILVRIYEYYKTSKQRKQINKQLNQSTDLILKCIKARYFLLKQKTKINTNQTKYINFIFTLNDVIQLLSLIPQKLSSYQMKSYLAYLFEESHQSIFILHNFIQSTIYKIDYMSLILKKYTQNQIKQSLSNVYSRKLTDKQKQTQCKKLFQSIILQNYVIISYQFSKKSPFNSNLYKSTHQLKQFQTIMKKIIAFDNCLKNISLIKRIYLESTLNFKQLKIINDPQSNFRFQSVYKFHADTDWIQQKARYLIHFSQFAMEILIEMSQNSTISMTVVFNSVRFFICFFLCHYYIHSVSKIFQEIKEKNGYFYFNVFFQKLTQSARWKEPLNKIYQILIATEKRLIAYEQVPPQIPLTENKKLVNNNEKFHQICRQNTLIKQLFYALKGKSQSSLEELIQQPYDFKTAKNLYTSTLFLIFSEYANKNTLRKNYEKKVLVITQEQIKEIKKINFNKKDLQNYLLFMSSNKKQLSFDLLTSERLELKNHQQYQFICQKFIVYYIETLKIISMILSLPYYSFQTQIENLRRKRKEKNERQMHNENILCTLDQFYINEGRKMLSNTVKTIIFDWKPERFFNYYSSLTRQLLQFVFKDNFQTKVKKLHQVLDSGFIKNTFTYPQFIHTDRCSIFTQDQCKQYFFQLFDGKILNEDVIENVKEFYQFIKTFNKKGGAVLRAHTVNASVSSQTKSNKEKQKKHDLRKMQER